MDEATPSRPATHVFDEAAATWDDNPARVALVTAIGETILREVRPSAETDVLEYGCGIGVLGLFLLPHVRSVTGADNSSGMLDVLQGKIREMALDNMEVMQLDLQRDPLPQRRFQLIVSAMTMHHVRDPDKLLRGFAELLCPGGVLCLADLDTEPGTFHPADVADTVHHHGFDRQQLKQKLKKLGLHAVLDTTAHTIRKETGEFPVFLIVARRPD